MLEVNWRSIHIDTGNGVQIVPNAVLAAASFTNLSRVHGPTFNSVATVQFSPNDPPGAITAALLSVARDLPLRNTRLEAKVTDLGEATYKIAVPVNAPSDEGPTKRPFCTASGTPRGGRICISTTSSTPATGTEIASSQN